MMIGRKGPSVSLSFRGTHRQHWEKERGDGNQLWISEKIKYCGISKSCSEGFVKIEKTKVRLHTKEMYTRERQRGSETCEMGLTYCEKCLSLGKGPHIYMQSRIYMGKKKTKKQKNKKQKSVWLYRTLKNTFFPNELMYMYAHTLIIL